MKSFNQFLIEARRNPISKKTGEELNPKKPPVERLEKYKDDNDIFISFISNAKDFTETGKSGALTAQVGLNTKSRYNTPNGIYTYPIAEVYDMYAGPSAMRFKRFNVPFVKDMPKIAILRRKGKFINEIGEGRSYARGNLAGDVKKMTLYAVPKLMKTLGVKNEMLMWLIVGSVIGYGMHKSSNKSDGGQFWNASRLLSSLIAHAGMVKKLDFEKKNTKRGIELYFRIGTLPNVYVFYFIVPDKKSTEGNKNWKKGMEVDEFEDYLDPQKEQKVSITIKNDWLNYVDYTSGTDIVTANAINPSEEKKDKGIANPYANAWANLLVNTGYDSIADRRGHGIIHQAEPVQAVFLSRRGYDVIDIIDNKTYEDRKPVLQKYRELETDEKKADFLQKIENIGISQGQENVRLWRFFEILKSNSIIVNSDVLKILVKKEPHTATEFYRTGHSVKLINELMKIGLKEKAGTLTVYVARGPECKIQPETIIFGLEELFRQKKNKDPKSMDSPLLDIRQALRMYENKWNKQNEDVIQAFRKSLKKAQDDAAEYLESEKSK